MTTPIAAGPLDRRVRCGCGEEATITRWTKDLGGYDGYEKWMQIKCTCGMQTRPMLDTDVNTKLTLYIWRQAFKTPNIEARWNAELGRWKPRSDEMTFDAYCKTTGHYAENGARVMWEAATKAAREACAKVCEQHGQTLGSILASEIRSRFVTTNTREE